MNITKALLLFLSNELDINLFMDIVRDNESDEKVINQIKKKLENKKVYMIEDQEPIALYSSRKEAERNLRTIEETFNEVHFIEEYEVDSICWRTIWTAYLHVVTGKIRIRESVGAVYKDKVNNTDIRKKYNVREIWAQSIISEEDAINNVKQLKQEYDNLMKGKR